MCWQKANVERDIKVYGANWHIILGWKRLQENAKYHICMEEHFRSRVRDGPEISLENICYVPQKTFFLNVHYQNTHEPKKNKQAQKCQKCFNEAEGPTLVKISRRKFLIEWGNVGHGMMESASYRSLGQRGERENAFNGTKTATANMFLGNSRWLKQHEYESFSTHLHMFTC